MGASYQTTADLAILTRPVYLRQRESLGLNNRKLVALLEGKTGFAGGSLQTMLSEIQRGHPGYWPRQGPLSKIRTRRLEAIAAIFHELKIPEREEFIQQVKQVYPDFRYSQPEDVE